MVPLTHVNLCASANNVLCSLALIPEDRRLNVMPLFHNHGLIAAVLASAAAGASIVCTSGFRVSEFYNWLEEFQPTCIPRCQLCISRCRRFRSQPRRTGSLLASLHSLIICFFAARRHAEPGVNIRSTGNRSVRDD
jgi:acyl-CoA synthetase (AMP-forming)/AMP-acid ligase II